jgi:hypothetical protein
MCRFNNLLTSAMSRIRPRAAIRAGRAQRLRKDGSQFVGFAAKRERVLYEFGSDDKIEPVDAFFGFLDDDGELGNEIRTRLSGADRTIIGRNRCCTPCQLSCHNIAATLWGNLSMRRKTLTENDIVRSLSASLCSLIREQLAFFVPCSHFNDLSVDQR